MEQAVTKENVFMPDQISELNLSEFVQAMEFAERNRDLLLAQEPYIIDAVQELTETYLHNDQYTQLKKLFKNAVVYVAEGRIRHAPYGGFFVEGNTDEHHVTVDQDGHMGCDCDLFQGRGKFEGRAGECSHMQTAQLFTLAEQKKPQIE